MPPTVDELVALYNDGTHTFGGLFACVVDLIDGSRAVDTLLAALPATLRTRVISELRRRYAPRPDGDPPGLAITSHCSTLTAAEAVAAAEEDHVRFTRLTLPAIRAWLARNPADRPS